MSCCCCYNPGIETPNNKGKRIELCSLLFIIFHILVINKIKDKFKDKFILQTKSSSSSFCLFLYVVFVSGEANAGNARDYSCRFPAMIDDWRSKFHSTSLQTVDATFPFGFVQVNYKYRFS